MPTDDIVLNTEQAQISDSIHSSKVNTNVGSKLNVAGSILSTPILLAKSASTRRTSNRQNSVGYPAGIAIPILEEIKEEKSSANLLQVPTPGAGSVDQDSKPDPVSSRLTEKKPKVSGGAAIAMNGGGVADCTDGDVFDANF